MNNITILMYLQFFIFSIVTFSVSFYLMLQIKNYYDNKKDLCNIYFITILDLIENKTHSKILEIKFTEITKHMKKEMLNSEITIFKYKILENNNNTPVYMNSDISSLILINIVKIE